MVRIAGSRLRICSVIDTMELIPRTSCGVPRVRPQMKYSAIGLPVTISRLSLRSASFIAVGPLNL